MDDPAMNETSVTSLLDLDQAVEHLRQLAAQLGGTEFVRVRNLDYIVSPFELYPLPPHTRPPLGRIAAFAIDMDGTSTTTEPLALHALEYMVRRFTGLLTPREWLGLDPKLDHPFVVGNSNFYHAEFLVGRYRDRMNPAVLRQAFFEAVCWTLACMDDAQRRREVTLNARNCGLGGMIDDAEFQRLVRGGTVTAENVGERVGPFVGRFGAAFACRHAGALAAAALDIYYFRYHAILREIEHGRGGELARELLGERGRRLIEPMPGYEVFLPLVKGWLGPEIDGLYELLRAELLRHSPTAHTAAELDAARVRLLRLAERFRRQPAKIALVTSSISFEAHVSMKEVIAMTAERVRDWPIAAEHRERVAARLADYLAVFDGFVNGSDACEHRLKPHRDVYSLALQQMSIPKEDYRWCVGLEDSEPGIVALRTAGIGCAVALPNRETTHQNYAAATTVVRSGLPELILMHNLLLRES
jgi:beta-phosphoglucomutase-like phosphatase (HAD superfamily)